MSYLRLQVGLTNYAQVSFVAV